MHKYKAYYQIIQQTFIIIFYHLLNIFWIWYFLHLKLHWILRLDLLKMEKQRYSLQKMLFVLKNHQPIFPNSVNYYTMPKSLSEHKALKFIVIYSNKITYKCIVFLIGLIWKRKKSKVEYNASDRYIGLFELRKIYSIQTALYRGIVMMKKWNRTKQFINVI